MTSELIADLAVTLGGDHGARVHATAARLQAFLDAESVAGRVVDEVQQQIHDEHICSTWPTCPRHRNHPLWRHGVVWVCERDGVTVARLGELHTVVRT